MERFMWSFDGVKMSDSPEPIAFRTGERVRVKLVNDTMMNHPIHIHGHFFEMVTGHGEFAPRKHTVNVMPGGTVTWDLTADAPGDAYFLDGFSPDRNPEMWAPRLFGQLVRLANKNATAASWCCASRVRESLDDAGFVVTKAPGFGRKREMMTAALRPSLGRGFLAGAGRWGGALVGKEGVSRGK